MLDFWTVLYLLFIGVVAGYLARLLVKGKDPMTWWQTILLGIIGSFVGGLVGYLLFGFDEDEGFFQPGGLIFSILGAVAALLIWRAVQRRRSTSTTTPDP